MAVRPLAPPQRSALIEAASKLSPTHRIIAILTAAGAEPHEISGADWSGLLLDDTGRLIVTIPADGGRERLLRLSSREEDMELLHLLGERRKALGMLPDLDPLDGRPLVAAGWKADEPMPASTVRLLVRQMQRERDRSIQMTLRQIAPSRPLRVVRDEEPSQPTEAKVVAVERVVREELTQTRPAVAHEIPVAVCRRCSGYPAVRGRLFEVRSRVLWGLLRVVRGPFCRECGTASFRDATDTTLYAGWWGPVPFVMSLCALVLNLLVRAELVALQPPYASGHVRPARRGAPLHARRGLWVSLSALAVVLVGLALWLV